MSEENIVKQTCKELGITQKQLAKRIGVAEITVSTWARGVVATPKWAVIMFDLLLQVKNNDQNKTMQDVIKLLQWLKRRLKSPI